MDWGGVLWHTAYLRGPTAQAVGPAPHFISALKGHGAPFNHNPPPLSKADVLIVVDMQNDFIEPDSFVSGCGSFGLSFTLRSSFFFAVHILSESSVFFCESWWWWIAKAGGCPYRAQERGSVRVQAMCKA